MILKTSKNEKHHHLVFIREDGTGYTSFDKDGGHYHQVVVTPEFLNFRPNNEKIRTEYFNTDPDKGPDNQNIAIDQTLSKYKLCQIIGVNGHTHKITGIKLSNPKKAKELQKDDEVKRIYDITKECMDNDYNSKKVADESTKFSSGDQWKNTVKIKLERMGLACNTHNFTKKYVKFLSGLFRNNKKDIQVLPEEVSDNFAVDMYNPALRRIQQNTDFHTHEVQSFDDVLKAGRGALLVDIDTSTNPFGDVSVKYFNWRDFSPMSHINIDGSDCPAVALHPFMSIDEITALYPDKADEINGDFARFDNMYQYKKEYVQYQDRQYEKSDRIYPFMTKEHLKYKWVDRIRREIMVITLLEKVKTNKKVAANSVEDEYVDITRMTKGDIEKFKIFPGFCVINSCETKIKQTVVAGNTLLEQKHTIFDDFNLCWCYADKEGNFWWSVVHDVKDTQREINKWSSKHTDLLNTADSWRLGVSREAFASEEDHRDYLMNASTPGFQPKFAPGFQQHVKEFNNSNFAQLRDVMSAVAQAINQMGDIINIAPATMGASEVAESGVAMVQRDRLGLIGNSYMYDNFSKMKLKVGRLMIQAIQKTWSPERILRLVESQDSREAITVGGNALYPELGPEELLQFGINRGIIGREDVERIAQGIQNQGLTREDQAVLARLQDEYRKFLREKYLLIIENNDLTRYDVSVVENTHSPTTMMSNFMILVDLARNRPDIPITSIIKSYPFMSEANKNEIIVGIQQAQQAQLQEQKMKYDMELQKTIIANQNKQGAGQVEQQVPPVA